MTNDIRLNSWPKMIMGTQPLGGLKDFASYIPVVVIKGLVTGASSIIISRFKNAAEVRIYSPFEGVDNHYRSIFFPRSELIDPFTWQVEDPHQFLQELLAERALLEKTNFVLA